jgi:hypothetical protein
MHINLINTNICLSTDGHTSIYAILSAVFPGERTFGEAMWEYCDIDPDFKNSGYEEVRGSTWLGNKFNTDGKGLRVEILKHRILFSEIWLSSFFLGMPLNYVFFIQ